jgi:branched-chain amino acid transport system ATP-binding protein
MSEQSAGGDAGRSMHDGAVLGKPDPVLVAEGLHKRFGGLVATDDASLEVQRGTITGLIGPNGAGKSTLFNLVSGFYEPDAGSVTVNGTDVTGQKPHERVDSGMVRTFQTPRKPEGMTVREAMLVGPQNQTGESIFALFTEPDQVRLEESEALTRADAMLKRFGIAHLAGEPATELSGGQMKLVELARAMMADPDLLLLDEPVAGVNPTLANKLRAFIRQLNQDGVTFLIIEHDMSFIMRLADPIIVLDQGHVLGEGSPEAVRNDERVIDAYLGGAP